MSNRFGIALVIYGVINAVVFGVGAIFVLSITALQEQWKFLLSIVIVASSVLAAPVAWPIAPRLRARNWRERRRK